MGSVYEIWQIMEFMALNQRRNHKSRLNDQILLNILVYGNVFGNKMNICIDNDNHFAATIGQIVESSEEDPFEKANFGKIKVNSSIPLIIHQYDYSLGIVSSILSSCPNRDKEVNDYFRYDGITGSSINDHKHAPWNDYHKQNSFTAYPPDPTPMATPAPTPMNEIGPDLLIDLRRHLGMMPPSDAEELEEYLDKEREFITDYLSDYNATEESTGRDIVNDFLEHIHYYLKRGDDENITDFLIQRNYTVSEEDKEAWIRFKNKNKGKKHKSKEDDSIFTNDNIITDSNNTITKANKNTTRTEKHKSKTKESTKSKENSTKEIIHKQKNKSTSTKIKNKSKDKTESTNSTILLNDDNTATKHKQKTRDNTTKHKSKQNNKKNNTNTTQPTKQQSQRNEETEETNERKRKKQ